MSGTAPLVGAEMIFCRAGAKGMMLSSILLPLAFSYAATALRSATSSSWTNPCANHTLAVVAAALAIWGPPNGRVAARAKDPRSIERLVRLVTVASFKLANVDPDSRVRSWCSRRDPAGSPRASGAPGANQMSDTTSDDTCQGDEGREPF